MGIKPMPEIGIGFRIPGPVGGFKILKNDPGILEFFGCIAPHVKIPVIASWLCFSGPLEPLVLIRSMIQDKFSNDPDIRL
jgi:hypothetical protein